MTTIQTTTKKTLATAGALFALTFSLTLAAFAAGSPPPNWQTCSENGNCEQYGPGMGDSDVDKCQTCTLKACGAYDPCCYAYNSNSPGNTNVHCVDQPVVAPN